MDAGLCRVMRQEFDDTEERYLREIIAMLQESYAKMAKPYIDRLAAINATRPPAPMIVTTEKACSDHPDALHELTFTEKG